MWKGQGMVGGGMNRGIGWLQGIVTRVGREGRTEERGEREIFLSNFIFKILLHY